MSTKKGLLYKVNLDSPKFDNIHFCIVHLLAIVCFYQAELSESGNEWADLAGKKRLFATMQSCTIIQFKVYIDHRMR